MSAITDTLEQVLQKAGDKTRRPPCLSAQAARTNMPFHEGTYAPLPADKTVEELTFEDILPVRESLDVPGKKMHKRIMTAAVRNNWNNLGDCFRANAHRTGTPEDMIALNFRFETKSARVLVEVFSRRRINFAKHCLAARPVPQPA